MNIFKDSAVVGHIFFTTLSVFFNEFENVHCSGVYEAIGVHLILL